MLAKARKVARTYRIVLEEDPDAGYVGATIFGNILKSLGLEVTRQRVKDASDRLANFDSGLGPRLSWSPGRHRANKTIYLAQIQRVGELSCSSRSRPEPTPGRGEEFVDDHHQNDQANARRLRPGRRP